MAIKYKIFDFKKGKIESDSIIHKDKLLSDLLDNDSGWINLPLASGVKEGQYLGTPQYRKIGNQVFVKGSVTFTPTSSGNVELATLPEGFRPPMEVTLPVLYNSQTLARVGIRKDGVIIAHSIVDVIANKVVTTNLTYFDLNCNFLID